MGDLVPTIVEEELVKFRAEYKDLEQRIKAFRDNLLPRSEVTRYVSLAYTELESSRHWLGEALGADQREQKKEQK